MSQKRYVVRDEKGILKSKLDERTGKTLILECEGHWKTFKYSSGPQEVFVLDVDYVLKIEYKNWDLDLFFWKGDRIEVNK